MNTIKFLWTIAVTIIGGATIIVFLTIIALRVLQIIQTRNKSRK